MFEQNLFRYLRSKYWENVSFNCFTVGYDKYKFKKLSEDFTDSYEQNLKDIRKKTIPNIVIGQLNISSLRNDLICMLNKSKGSSMY